MLNDAKASISHAKCFFEEIHKRKAAERREYACGDVLLENKNTFRRLYSAVENYIGSHQVISIFHYTAFISAHSTDFLWITSKSDCPEK